MRRVSLLRKRIYVVSLLIWSPFRFVNWDSHFNIQAILFSWRSSIVGILRNSGNIDTFCMNIYRYLRHSYTCIEFSKMFTNKGDANIAPTIGVICKHVVGWLPVPLVYS